MDKDPQCLAAPFWSLLEAPRCEAVALLHSCAAGPATLFSEPLAEIFLGPGEWSGAWEALETFLRRNDSQKSVGFLGYDLRHDIEELPRSIPEEFPFPSLHFVTFGRAKEWPEGQVHEVPPPPQVPAGRNLRAHSTRADYEARVAQVVEHIRAGDIFQANLTQPFTAEFDGDPRLLFWRLCHQSPAPFAAYFETGRGEAVLCSSPEEFLFVDGEKVRTRPIKGTRPRGPTPTQDQRLLKQLLSSEKDQAELAMIVDLLRNDLGKVAVPGSVQVGPFPEHQSYAEVHHTFATIEARLLPERSLVDLLRATFPSGSITGAPKLRCMEIIEELELVRRGVYTGALGWIGPGRRMHLNVAIRTMAYSEGRLRFNAGGGITADSTPAKEFEETMHKAAGMVRSLNTELLMP